MTRNSLAPAAQSRQHRHRGRFDASRFDRPGGSCQRHRRRLRGPIFAVHPEPLEVPGATWVRRIAELPTTPDLALVCCASAKVADVVDALGRRRPHLRRSGRRHAG